MFLEVNARPSYIYTGGKTLDPSKPSVVFIHGAQNDHSVWALQSRYFANHGFNALALDLPGHGRSEGPPLESIEALAGWVLDLLAQAQIASSALVGHSMGSLVALEAAARAPKQILGLALLGTAFPMKVSDALLGACKNDEPAAFDMINRFSHSSLAHLPGSPGPGFSVFWQGRRLMERQSPGVLLKDFEACNQYLNGTQAASAVQCPTLIVSGENDAMTPPRAALALKDILASKLRERLIHNILKNCGHALMAEQPDETLFALKQFFATKISPS